MISKSYIIENNINLINKNLILFYGENLGLKNDFKKKIIIKYKDSEILRYSQDEICKNEEGFLKEIFNISLFQKKKIFLVVARNQILLKKNSIVF